MLRPLAIAILASLTLAPPLASAQKTTPIAILGLEVRGKMDMATVKVAKKITDGLRKRASAGGGPHKLAANSNKDLSEVKLLNDCEGENKACMAGIGKSLGAAFLLYGSVTKQKNDYQVSLVLLNTATASNERTLNELLGETVGDDLDEVAKGFYNKIVGIQVAGAVQVGSDVDGTTVTVDGGGSVVIERGTAKLDNLSEGEHELVFEAPGYAKMARKVTVTGGEVAVINVSMTSIGEVSGGGGSGGSGKTSRILFWTSAAATAAVGGFMAYNWFSLRSAAEDDIESSYKSLCAEDKAYCDAILAMQNPAPPDGKVDACGATKDQPNNNLNYGALRDACDRGERSVTLAYVGWGLFGATSIAASYFFYKGYVQDGDDEEKPVVRVTPTVTSHTVGAGLSFDF